MAITFSSTLPDRLYGLRRTHNNQQSWYCMGYFGLFRPDCLMTTREDLQKLRDAYARRNTDPGANYEVVEIALQPGVCAAAPAVPTQTELDTPADAQFFWKELKELDPQVAAEVERLHSDIGGLSLAELGAHTFAVRERRARAVANTVLVRTRTRRLNSR